MKLVLLAVLMMLTPSIGFTQGQTDVGNGAGGIKRTIDGETHFLTFGEIWQTQAKPPSYSWTKLPGYQRLKEALAALPISETRKNAIRKGYVATEEERRYFIVDDSEVNPELRLKLINDYEAFIDTTDEVVPQESDEIVLYAFTINQKDTYLLPAFFELGNENAQAAILAHEAFRVRGIEDTSEAVNLQVAFFDWMENKNLGRILYALGDYFNSLHLKIRGAFETDLVNPRLNHLFIDDKLKYSALYEDSNFIESFGNSDPLAEKLNLRLWELQSENPESLLIKLLLKEEGYNGFIAREARNQHGLNYRNMHVCEGVTKEALVLSGFDFRRPYRRVVSKRETSRGGAYNHHYTGFFAKLVWHEDYKFETGIQHCEFFFTKGAESSGIY
jgi:hypothetical protein